MNTTFSWRLAVVFTLAASQMISAQTAGTYPNIWDNNPQRRQGRANLEPAARAIPAAGIIPIGSPLTFGGTNAPDTYSATTTFSSTPVLVDNGAVRIWQEQVATGPTGEWDIFYMQTTNGGPLANNIGAYWNIVMTYVLSAPAFFDGVANQWTVNGAPVGPLTNFLSICCATTSNPILPGAAYYHADFSAPFPAGPFSNWQQIFASPYSAISQGGVNPSTANGFTFALHFTLQAASQTYVVAHFPYRAGWSSRTLIGAGANGSTVDVNFFDPAGATATVPLEGQGNQSTQHLVLGPNAVKVVGADPAQRNASANLTVNWALATSTAPLNVFTLFDYGPASAPTSVPATKIQGSVGAQSTVAAKSFHFPASFYGPLGYNAGVAIANPNASATTYTVTVLNADGTTKGSIQPTALPPKGQAIFVVTDILPGVITPDSVTPFTGSVVVCASQPVGLVAIGVEGSAFFTTSVTNDFTCP